jgi:hypothetical protein
MKIVRWIAAAALTLMSLMDIGIALPGGSEPVPVRVLVPLLGVAGLAAVYGCVGRAGRHRRQRRKRADRAGRRQ